MWQIQYWKKFVSRNNSYYFVSYTNKVNKNTYVAEWSSYKKWLLRQVLWVVWLSYTS